MLKFRCTAGLAGGESQSLWSERKTGKTLKEFEAVAMKQKPKW